MSKTKLLKITLPKARSRNRVAGAAVNQKAGAIKSKKDRARSDRSEPFIPGDTDDWAIGPGYDPEPEDDGDDWDEPPCW